MVLLHVEANPAGPLHYIEEQYLGELEAMEKWVEKVEHLEAKQRRTMMNYPRPKIRPVAVAGKSEPHEDEPAKRPPCQRPRLICCSLMLHDPVNHTSDTCGYGR
jgi:hypothetical protein